MELGRWPRALVFFRESGLMDTMPMGNYDGIELPMFLLLHWKCHRITRNSSNIGTRIPINGSRIMSTCALHHGERNLAFEVPWRRLPQVQSGTGFIQDII